MAQKIPSGSFRVAEHDGDTRAVAAMTSERERDAQKRLAAQLYATKVEVQAEQEELRQQRVKQERERAEMEARLEAERVERERKLYEARLDTIEALYKKAVRAMQHQQLYSAWWTWAGLRSANGAWSTHSGHLVGQNLARRRNRAFGCWKARVGATHARRERQAS